MGEFKANQPSWEDRRWAAAHPADPSDWHDLEGHPVIDEDDRAAEVAYLEERARAEDYAIFVESQALAMESGEGDEAEGGDE